MSNLGSAIIDTIDQGEDRKLRVNFIDKTFVVRLQKEMTADAAVSALRLLADYVEHAASTPPGFEYSISK